MKGSRLMMEKKKVKPGPAVKSSQPKPVRNKRRLFLWIFLMLFLISGLVGAGFYYRLVPLDTETALKTLEDTGFSIKEAIVIILTGVTKEEAERRIAENKGFIRKCI